MRSGGERKQRRGKREGKRKRGREEERQEERLRVERAPRRVKKMTTGGTGIRFPRCCCLPGRSVRLAALFVAECIGYRLRIIGSIIAICIMICSGNHSGGTPATLVLGVSCRGIQRLCHRIKRARFPIGNQMFSQRYYQFINYITHHSKLFNSEKSVSTISLNGQLHHLSAVR